MTTRACGRDGEQSRPAAGRSHCLPVGPSRYGAPAPPTDLSPSHERAYVALKPQACIYPCHMSPGHAAPSVPAADAPGPECHNNVENTTMP